MLPPAWSLTIAGLAVEAVLLVAIFAWIGGPAAILAALAQLCGLAVLGWVVRHPTDTAS